MYLYVSLLKTPMQPYIALQRSPYMIQHCTAFLRPCSVLCSPSKGPIYPYIRLMEISLPVKLQQCLVRGFSKSSKSLLDKIGIRSAHSHTCACVHTHAIPARSLLGSLVSRPGRSCLSLSPNHHVPMHYKL